MADDEGPTTCVGGDWSARIAAKAAWLAKEFGIVVQGHLTAAEASAETGAIAVP